MRLRLVSTVLGVLSLSFALGAQTITMEKGDKAQSPPPKSKQKKNKKQELLPPDPPYIAPIYHEPITWTDQSVSPDLDCDGAPDTLTLGSQEVTHSYYYDGAQHSQRAEEVVLRADVTGKHERGLKTDKENIPLRKTTGYYGFCGGTKHFERIPLSCTWEGGKLPGCDVKRKCEAIRITDDCSEFLVFWNWDLDKLSWVRPSYKLSK